MMNSAVAPRIVRYREAVRLSRINLADASGVSRFRMWEFENGRRELTAEEKTALVGVLAAELNRVVVIAQEFKQAELAG